MRPRRLVPPPEKATWMDVYRIILGFLMIPLGITILVRSYLTASLSPASVILSLAFIGFGVYRLYVGFVRYRLYRSGLQKQQDKG